MQIFETTSSIDESLRLLQKLQETVYSESLKAELKGKISLIIHRYSVELVQVRIRLNLFTEKETWLYTLPERVLFSYRR